jgi:hypothetical protein
VNNIERWTLLVCHRCGRTGLHAGDCYEGAVYSQQSTEIEVVRATAYEGAVEDLREAAALLADASFVHYQPPVRGDKARRARALADKWGQ